MSAANRLRGKLAIETRWRPDEDHTELRRDYTAERLAEHIAKVVAEAPPLTAEQRDRLAGLLRGGGASA